DGAAEHVTAMPRPTESLRGSRSELREPAAASAGEPVAAAAEPAGGTVEPETPEATEGEAAPSERAPTPASTPQPLNSVPLLGEEARGDAQARAPLPIRHDQEHESTDIPAAPEIRGVYCKNGHFDDPEARFCAVCGISMNQKTLVPQSGLRPPLGLLV